MLFCCGRGRGEEEVRASGLRVEGSVLLWDGEGGDCRAIGFRVQFPCFLGSFFEREGGVWFEAYGSGLLLEGAGDLGLSKLVISTVLIRVTPCRALIALLITYLLNPLRLQVKTPILGGSGVVINGAISHLVWVISIVTLFITVFMSPLPLQVDPKP